LNGTTITATGAAQSFTLQPGEYHVYLNRNAALPVTLINFSGKNNGVNNVLSWTVSNEQSAGYYELERSTDGQHFSFVSKVIASGRNNYDYIDNISAANFPVYFYRLKNIDKDGKFSYSAIVKLRLTGKGLFVQVSPNPFTERLNVNIESLVKDKATIILADFSGRQLYKKNIQLSPGNNAFEINETSKLSKGNYFLTIISSQQTQSIRVIKGN
jgi:hypothetical protein